MVLCEIAHDARVAEEPGQVVFGEDLGCNGVLCLSVA